MFSKSIPNKANSKAALGSAVQTMADMCLWDETIETELKKSIFQGNKSPFNPFVALHLSGKPHFQKLAAEEFANHHFNDCNADTTLKCDRKTKVYRLGYFSADINDHPVAQMLGGVLRHHDRKKFKIFVYSYGYNSESRMRMEIQKSADIFKDVAAYSSDEIIKISRQDNLDIAIDLNGFTKIID